MSSTCSRLLNHWDARSQSAILHIFQSEGQDFCEILEQELGTEALPAALSVITSSEFRGREVGTFLKSIRKAKPLFVAINDQSNETLQQHTINTGMDVENGFWYSSLVGPTFSYGFAPPDPRLLIPQDLLPHESTSREVWCLAGTFGSQSFWLEIQRKIPNAPFTWDPDLPGSRSLYKITAIVNGQHVGSPTVTAEPFVNFQANPFRLTIGTILTWESVTSTNIFPMNLRYQNHEFVLKSLTDMPIRLDQEAYLFSQVSAEGSLSNQAVNGRYMLYHAWDSQEVENGFRTGYFARALDVFPRRRNPGSLLPRGFTLWIFPPDAIWRIQWHEDYMLNTPLQATLEMFTEETVAHEVVVRVVGTDTYGTHLEIQSENDEFVFTPNYQTILNLIWKPQNNNQSIEARRLYGTCVGEFQGQNMINVFGWWIDQTRQSQLNIAESQLNLLNLTNSNPESFLTPKPSQTQAAGAFFLFFSPFLIAGLLLFGILFGLRLSRRNAIEK